MSSGSAFASNPAELYETKSPFLSTIFDIDLAICDFLDLVTSVLLGITCKHFYGLDVAKWGLRVSLLSRSDRATPYTPSPAQGGDNYLAKTRWGTTDLTKYINKSKNPIYLRARLKDWMGPRYAFCVKSHRYFRKESCTDEIPDGEAWNIEENSDGWPWNILRYSRIRMVGLRSSYLEAWNRGES